MLSEQTTNNLNWSSHKELHRFLNHLRVQVNNQSTEELRQMITELILTGKVKQEEFNEYYNEL